MHSFRRINFRKATKNKEPKVANELKTTNSDQTENGKEVQDFYESIIATPSQNEGREITNIREKPRDVTAKTNLRKKKRGGKGERSGNLEKNKRTILKCAQDGDLKLLKTVFERSHISVNITDEFHWTPLMCAACAGHKHVVEFLLENGASVHDYVDKYGRDALQLAQMKNNDKIVSLLKFHSERHYNAGYQESGGEVEEYWCPICKIKFSETSREEHETSTVHLFNCQHKPQSSMYYILEGNKGFQMMLNNGWDTEKGLGPEGKEGYKYPVKTILKRDRQGLGADSGPSSKPKITHFKPFDVNAVKKPKLETKMPCLRNSTISKRERYKKELKTKAWEVEFRQSFYLE